MADFAWIAGSDLVVDALDLLDACGHRVAAEIIRRELRRASPATHTGDVAPQSRETT